MQNHSEKRISEATSRLLQSSLRADKPSIAVCIPSTDTWEADFGVALAILCSRLHTSTSRFYLINRKSCRVAVNRNHMVRAAIEQEADYVLFLDADMVFPPDVLDRLLAHNKDIVGGTYVRRAPPHTTLGVPLPGTPKTYRGGCVEVAGLPTGCMLVKTTVFKALAEPWFMEPPVELEGKKELMGEDYFFCSLAANAGFKIWMDVELSHALIHIGRGAYQIQEQAEQVEANAA